MRNKVIEYIEITQNTQILKPCKKNKEFVMALSRPILFYQLFKRKGGGNSPNLKHQSKCKRINSYVIQVFTIFGHVKTL